MLRVALEHVADGNFLVPGFAEEADDGLRLGERAVALADFEPFLALLDGGGAVRRVHDGDRAFGPCGPVLAQHREREAVERAAVDAAGAVAEQIRGRSSISRWPAGKREQQHVACRDACSASQARRWTIVRVLPLPAPAMTRTGPSGAVTASSWAGVECRNVYHWNSVGRGCLRLSAAARTHAFRRAGEIALRAMPVSSQARLTATASPPLEANSPDPLGAAAMFWKRCSGSEHCRRLRERQAPSSPGWFREKVFSIKTQTPPKHKSFGGGKRIFAFGCPSPVLRAFKARCGNACLYPQGRPATGIR